MLTLLRIDGLDGDYLLIANAVTDNELRIRRDYV
jgi:hypothetical protein